MQNRFGFPVPPLAGAFTHPRARLDAVELLCSVGASIGLSRPDAEALPGLVQQVLANDAAGAETVIRQWIASRISTPGVTAEFSARSSQICSQIQPFVRGPAIADIGCGDGLVAATLDGAFQIELVDVVDYVDPRVRLPFHHYSGRGPLPFERSVDCSLLLTVLHHCESPDEVLRETMRVTTSRIIVIESVVPEPSAPDFDAQFLIAAFFDWFYNRVLHSGVPVPFNYNSVAGWKSMFNQHDWRMVHLVDLGRDQKLVPERHVLFILDRMGA